MILVIHISAALLSLVTTGLAFFYPSINKLRASYALVALMLITGFALILSKPVNITQTCLEGLGYLGVVSYGIILARKKLATLN